MVMVGVASGSLQADSHPSRLAWAEGRRPLGATPYSSYEPDDLLKCLSHNDSTINIIILIIVVIIIIIIIINPTVAALRSVLRLIHFTVFRPRRSVV